MLASQQLPYPNEVWALAFSPDNRQLYLVFPHAARVVDLTDMQVEEWREPRQLCLLGFVEGGEQVAVANRDRVMFLHSATGMQI